MPNCGYECYEMRIMQQQFDELLKTVLKLGREVKKPWYSPDDIAGYRRYMTLMFTLESEAMGQKYAMAIKTWNFPLLNNLLLNTELGRDVFPGLTLANLRVVCMYKQNFPTIEE